VNKFDALVDAIVHYSGYQQPGSPLYLARNPGGLKAFSPKHIKDEQGNRVFSSVLDGFQALIYDLETKLTGKSRAHLESDNTLVHLALSYNLKPTSAQAWARFLRQATKDESISAHTRLDYFTEETK
jgi:hypothetical protein